MLAFSMRITGCALMLGACLWSKTPKPGEDAPAVLWRDPGDIAMRNLYYGQGGKDHEPAPAGEYIFVEEDREGHSPKFVVQDGQGTKWKVKLGDEARPETSATRLLWAVGYLTDEDYFLPSMQVNGMPAKLSRGHQFVSSDGHVMDARWERMEGKKLGKWRWGHNPFSKTRELDGLRVMMSLLNNYDMKDTQNSVYLRDGMREYVVSDIGATLGGTGSRWPGSSVKGKLDKYRDSDFIKKTTDKYVDFAAPSWPMMFGAIPILPLPYPILTSPVVIFGRTPAPNVVAQRWIGKGVPLEHVRWITELLRQLSPEQLRDAFRAAHFTPEEVEGFSSAVETRIAKLTELARARASAQNSPAPKR